MRIDSNSMFIKNNVYGLNRNNKNLNTEHNILNTNLDQYTPKKQLNRNSEINKNLMPFGKVYNSSYVEQSSNISNKELYKNEDEITLELDRMIYDRCSLKKLKGFEFNSPEFIKWKKENPHYSTVPMDAPVKIRKTLTDMIYSVPREGALRFQVAEAIKNQLENYDTTNPDSFVDACDNIIQDNTDYINLVKICGSDSQEDRNAIESSMYIINFMTQFKNNIS